LKYSATVEEANPTVDYDDEPSLSRSINLSANCYTIHVEPPNNYNNIVYAVITLPSQTISEHSSSEDNSYFYSKVAGFLTLNYEAKLSSNI